jgi:hypothetical protein
MLLIICAYLVISTAIAIRFFYIANYNVKIWREETEVNIELKPLLKGLIKSAFSWPWYVLWFGIKQFIQELRK